MAKGKSKDIDPIGRMPNLYGPFACVDYLADTPNLIDTQPLKVNDGEAPTPSQHPNKSNPGVVRYYGGNA
jgi:hypothetical protein